MPQGYCRGIASKDTNSEPIGHPGEVVICMQLTVIQIAVQESVFIVSRDSL